MLATKLKHPVSTDMEQVDKLIISSLSAEMPFVQEVGMHLIKSGGKRLRPLLVLLCAKACGYRDQQHITMAAVVEFIHTATLLHDDVVDNSELRRGKITANQIWGNKAAILVGDFLYSRSFQLMLSVDSPKIMQIISDATNLMAQGEVLQLMYQNNPKTTEMDYLHMIRCKTAKLFEAASQIGAVLANAPIHIQNAAAQFGLHLGTAYQLIDDLLDYQANPAELGKQIGNDCAEGKPTLPLIYICNNGTEAQKKLVRDAINQTAEVDLQEIQRAINESGALQYTRDFAEREATLAKQVLSELPDSEFRTAAQELTEFVFKRSH